MKNKVVINEKVTIGDRFCVIGGPCAVESLEQLDNIACKIKDSISILRGGAYKPRTKYYSFQGLEEDGLKILSAVAKKHNLLTVTEITDPRHIKVISSNTDIIQIGARNMQNFALLREVGRIKIPVMLKRGFANNIDEWLSAAEYITSEGNNNVILCERGVRSFDTSTRFTLDLAGAVLAQKKSSHPVIVDPSHATGVPYLVRPMSLAAKAAGLDGVMIEVHDNPSTALCDGDQSLSIKDFINLVSDLERMNT